MTILTELTLSEARDGLKKKEFSSLEITQAHLKKMEETRTLNAYTLETPESAIEAAERSDIRLAKGEAGSLEGLPIAIKDMFCTADVPTTAGSKFLSKFVPPYESTVTRNLFNDGAVMLGKLNCDEFAMGSANITSAYGPVLNPWKRQGDDTNLVPGGSSGGSSAAVAANAALAATGTDTGGSIRQPAAFCGIVGLKPTYGRCSRWGIVAFASSLDQAGPMTKTVRDAAIMLESMAGYDPKDATSVNKPVDNYESFLTGSLKGIRIGIPKEYRVDGLSESILKMWDDGIEWLKSEGAQIVDISLPHTKYALPAYYIIAPAEASSNLARYDGVRFTTRAESENLIDLYENSRAEGFGDEVKRRIMIGTYVLSAGYYDAYYRQAQKIRRLISNDFDNAFGQVDLILSPSTPNAAFDVDNPPTDPVEMFMNDVLTVPANLAGLPGISVPAALTSSGLPLGLQLISPAFQEGLLLRAGDVIEKYADFRNRTKHLRKAS